jgi:hypothetical protein
VPRTARFAVVALIALAVSSPAGAKLKPGFTNDVCALLSAKQVSAISGLSAKCTNAAPSQGPGSTIYVGNWAGLTPTSPTLQVTIASYADASLLKLAKHNLKQGLSGPPEHVTGLGGPAYEAKGAFAVGIHITVGKYLAYISLNTIKQPPSSPKLIEPVAKAVAAKL